METGRCIILDVDFSKTILIFSDGACSGNPGPGGLGVIVVTPQGFVKEIGEYHPSTTNNRMEIMAAMRGLKSVSHLSGDIALFTDSTYLIRGITQWIWGWKKRNWTTAEGTPVNNRDLWEMLEQEIQSRKKLGHIKWHYLRGHQGIPGNERCDEIAVSFTKQQPTDLFNGTLLNYSIPIHDLPEDMSLPPMKKKEEKKTAHSYLSYVDGILRRHSSWSECEIQVKGRSGAKFKKSHSPDDELKIVTEWGLHIDSLNKLSKGH